MKLCKDCRWAKGLEGLWKTDEPYDYHCQHPTSVTPSRPDLVLGRPQPATQLLCLDARDDPDRCGPDGRYWEPRA